MGKVLWHSLTEDGKVEIVKIKFGNKIYDNVNVKHLNPIDEGSHSHPKRKKNADKKKKQESKMGLKLEELVGKKLTEEQFDEAAGKKDACYHKVKARYDVWPSAYASGALVKCRKVGAANWGNKSKKKEGVDEKVLGGKDMTSSIDKGTKITFSRNLPTGYRYLAGKTFKVSKKGINTFNVLPDGSNNEKDTKTLDAPTILKLLKNKNISKIVNSKGKKLNKEGLDEKRGTCWVGYQQVGMKKKGGKMVPNCVKEIIEVYYEENGEGHGYTLEHTKDLSLTEAEYQGRKVKLGKVMQGDQKKFKVYVKNPKGNVVKVNFGQGGKAKGGTMRIRKSNPKARANFRARHNCDNPGPRHKARYWSCRKW